MIDASRGFIKDGNKNRLREQDVYRIVTTFNEEITSDPKYARFVPNSEIKNKRNDYNLNITRYIDSSDKEDVQDIDAHIHGGIPAADIEGLSKYWEVFTGLRESLFTEMRPGFYQLITDKDEVRHVVYNNEAFAAYGEVVDEAYASWKEYAYPHLISIDDELEGKLLIADLAYELIVRYEPIHLLDKYDVYQVLLAYWDEVMNDDVTMIATDEKGYALARETENIMGKYESGKKKGQEKVIGWEGRLIPKDIIIDYFFMAERDAISSAEDVIAQTEAELAELIENADEDTLISELADEGKIKKKDLDEKLEEIHSKASSPAIKALQTMLEVWPTITKKKDYTLYVNEHPLCVEAYTEKGTISKTSIIYAIKLMQLREPVPEAYKDDVPMLEKADELMKKIAEYTSMVKGLSAELDKKCREQYEKLTDEEVIELLVNRKWFRSIYDGIDDLYTAISHYLASRIVTLVDRYEKTLPQLTSNVSDLEAKVKSHLERMGFAW